MSQNNIKEVCKQQGRRLGWLAGQLGVSPPTLTKVINGQTKLTLERRNLIAEILDVTPQEIAE